jgi:large subunit ribosomal protein L4
MASAPVLGGKESVTLDDEVFGVPFNGPLVHEVVVAELNARRQGTAATKSRGQVRGGGAKPWRQKGTGRARAGSTRSPLWAGGGHVFALQPRRYIAKVNRKARRAALRSALSVHAERNSVAVLDALDTPSTKTAVSLLGDRVGKSVLIVVAPDQDVTAKSFRNLERVTIAPADNTGVADIVGASNLVFTREALEQLTTLAKKPTGAPRPRGPEAAPQAEEGANA